MVKKIFTVIILIILGTSTLHGMYVRGVSDADNKGDVKSAANIYTTNICNVSKGFMGYGYVLPTPIRIFSEYQAGYIYIYTFMRDELVYGDFFPRYTAITPSNQLVGFRSRRDMWYHFFNVYGRPVR